MDDTYLVFGMVCKARCTAVWMVCKARCTAVWMVCKARCTAVWMVCKARCTAVWMVCKARCTAAWMVCKARCTAVWMVCEARCTAVWMVCKARCTAAWMVLGIIVCVMYVRIYSIYYVYMCVSQIIKEYSFLTAKQESFHDSGRKVESKGRVTESCRNQRFTQKSSFLPPGTTEGGRRQRGIICS